MKGLIITHKGMESFCADEVKELVGAKCKTDDSVVVFDLKPDDLSILAYKAQSACKVLGLLDSFNVKNLDKDLADSVGRTDLAFLDKDKTFKAEARVDGGYDGYSAAQLGELIIDKVRATKKHDQRVDLDNPDEIFFLYVNGKNGYLCIDPTGTDLSKREYRIFTRATSLKGTVAYLLLRAAGYKKGKVLLDPFCGTGEIPIEAALYATGTAVNYYRKDALGNSSGFAKLDRKITTAKNIYGYDSLLHNVKNAQKNAKIAGIHKSVNFSRQDIEWLDTKFEAGSVDCIAANPPDISSRTNLKEMEKIYREFFHQAEFVLKNKGRAALISGSERSVELLRQAGLVLESEHSLWHGKKEEKILVFRK
ncbi:MAG: methyltransferase domain-containing protein [archaeon]